MRRRWSRAAVVACLVLLAAACAESSRALPAGEGGGTGTGTGTSTRGRDSAMQRSAFDVMVVGLVSIGLGRQWRAAGDDMVDEDKRRVPTGPNPLHNR